MLLCERIVSADDRDRLIPILDRARSSWMTYAPYLDAFGTELRSRAVAPPDVPRDVITMNSRFALAQPRDEGSICYTLVYPEKESPQQGKVSVMSPMGAALLGGRVGEEVCWISSDGPELVKVQRLLY